MLTENDMLLPCELYKQVLETESELESDQNVLFPEDAYAKVLGKPILQMSDFNSLIALSQKHKVPIFDLTDAQLGYGGVVLEQAKEPMLQFRKLYSEGAARIMTLVEND